VIANKAKGQSETVAKPELLAFTLTFGGLAEWSNATDCKSVNGGHTTVLGFESLTRRQISSPMEALTSTREIDRRAEAARIRKFSIRLLAVELNRRFHSDLPQLPDRCPESR
jgi:hypothetical protein